MTCVFQKITDFPRGTLAMMLSDAYSFDPRCAESWGNDWKTFDDFFFDNPQIAERCGFITVVNDEPVGFVSWDPRHNPEYEEIGHNCVRSKFKRQGVGTLQMQEAIRRISLENPHKIIVTTSALMIPAQKMYERAGFRQTGERPTSHFSGALIDYEYPVPDESQRLQKLQESMRGECKQILGDNLVGVYLHGSPACCRYEAYRQNGVLPSKPDSGQRGLRQLPETKHGAIRAAIPRYQPLEIRALRTDELQSPLFDRFNRHQEVTECWRKENGKWQLKPIAFVEEWDLSKLDAFYVELRTTIAEGGAVFGAFTGRSLIGFAAVESKFFGHAHKYVQMTELHVSCEWRGCGIGRKLFGEICRQARIYGAERLYISGHSSKESQAFYHALGCVEAVEYNDVIFAAEPCDCQLEYDLKEIKMQDL